MAPVSIVSRRPPQIGHSRLPTAMLARSKGELRNPCGRGFRGPGIGFCSRPSKWRTQMVVNKSSATGHHERPWRASVAKRLSKPRAPANATGAGTARSDGARARAARAGTVRWDMHRPSTCQATLLMQSHATENLNNRRPACKGTIALSRTALSAHPREYACNAEAPRR